MNTLLPKEYHKSTSNAMFVELFMSNKPDFLKECMKGFGNVPLDDFNAAFCALCHNRDCARSNASTMLFDQRVLSWHDRLFTNVPTANPDDPAFDPIRSKEFKPVAPGNVTVPAFFSVGSSVKRPAPPEASDASVGAEEKEAVGTEVGESVGTENVTPEPHAVNGGNTPFQQGTMIGDATPKFDSEVVMEPGQTFTFEDE